jgi:hypothetical protein
MTVTQTTVTGSGNSMTTTYGYSYTYNKSEPTVTDWDTGWSAADVTGWSYVGSDNGASAVYLGNGYVLTAGHVGAGNFILGNNTYDIIPGSSKSFGTADLSLFKINTTSTTDNVLSLPALKLETSAPSVGSSLVMIGYGNSQGETWGVNTVYETGQDANLTSLKFDSTDIFAVDSFEQTGSTTTGNTTVTTYLTNDGQLVPGDSGGGDFIYNTSTATWSLAGINEVQLENDSGVIVGSGMVQISTYEASIEADMVPEPPAWLLLGAGLASVWGLGRWRLEHFPRFNRG